MYVEAFRLEVGKETKLLNKVCRLTQGKKEARSRKGKMDKNYIASVSELKETFIN